MARKATNKILELVEKGLIDRDTLIAACLDCMSEYDVAEMARCEGFIPDEENDEENEEE